MRALLEGIFSLFGNKALCQVIGATVIGMIPGDLFFLRTSGRLPAGEFRTCVIGGAAVGFTAGFILVSPRVFFGVFFGLLAEVSYLGFDSARNACLDQEITPFALYYPPTTATEPI